MTKFKILILYVLINIFSGISAQQYTLSGIVTDADTNETLIGVPITIKELYATGVSSSENGEYNIKLYEKNLFKYDFSYSDIKCKSYSSNVLSG
ncbi:MAG: hypothetical protein E6767_17615 [Dysgonomonas sp.]|nr:hypothetical protein [Dysgonomonas sp.]